MTQTELDAIRARLNTSVNDGYTDAPDDYTEDMYDITILLAEVERLRAELDSYLLLQWVDSEVENPSQYGEYVIECGGIVCTGSFNHAGMWIPTRVSSLAQHPITYRWAKFKNPRAICHSM